MPGTTAGQRASRPQPAPIITAVIIEVPTRVSRSSSLQLSRKVCSGAACDPETVTYRDGRVPGPCA